MRVPVERLPVLCAGGRCRWAERIWADGAVSAERRRGAGTVAGHGFGAGFVDYDAGGPARGAELFH